MLSLPYQCQLSWLDSLEGAHSLRMSYKEVHPSGTWEVWLEIWKKLFTEFFLSLSISKSISCIPNSEAVLMRKHEALLRYF